jgi:hypothetical protein
MYYNTKAPEYHITIYDAPDYYTEVPKHYSAPSYNTEVPAYNIEAPKFFFLPATIPSFQLLPKRSNTTPKRPSTNSAPSYTTITDSAKYYRNPDLLHSRCSFVLRWTEILHRGSSLLYHNLRYTVTTLELQSTDPRGPNTLPPRMLP